MDDHFVDQDKCAASKNVSQSTTNSIAHWRKVELVLMCFFYFFFFSAVFVLTNRKSVLRKTWILFVRSSFLHIYSILQCCFQTTLVVWFHFVSFRFVVMNQPTSCSSLFFFFIFLSSWNWYWHLTENVWTTKSLLTEYVFVLYILYFKADDSWKTNV